MVLADGIWFTLALLAVGTCRGTLNLLALVKQLAMASESTRVARADV